VADVAAEEAPWADPPPRRWLLVAGALAPLVLVTIGIVFILAGAHNAREDEQPPDATTAVASTGPSRPIDAVQIVERLERARAEQDWDVVRQLLEKDVSTRDLRREFAQLIDSQVVPILVAPTGPGRYDVRALLVRRYRDGAVETTRIVCARMSVSASTSFVAMETEHELDRFNRVVSAAEVPAGLRAECENSPS
jgi:hypothetical protein